ncbi:MAG: sulfotransferase [Chloroflexi bacterium]|nr:sulfotransferase [Chloroflexota bacterium]
MTEIVFIAGLSHSGSTLLDLLLGAHPRLTGLGELDKVLAFTPEQYAEERVMPCTCGRPVSECAFWAGAFDALPGLPAGQRAAPLLAHFAAVFGPEAMPVDSSKYLPALERWLDAPGVSVRVLHVIKDVRSFVVSQRDALEKERGRGRLARAAHRLTTRQPAYLFWKWHLRNRAIARFCARGGLAHYVVSYDRLCLEPEAALRGICDFLGLEFHPGMLSPANTGSHVFWGNPMAGDRQRHAAIRYDDRWQARRDWRLAARLFPGILRESAELSGL